MRPDLSQRHWQICFHRIAVVRQAISMLLDMVKGLTLIVSPI
jgi:hypothetical protein